MRNLYKIMAVLLLAATVSFMTGKSLSAQTVQVTFRVNMAEAGEISPLGVHIAGDFQGWDPAGTEMNQPPFGTVYTYTAELTPGETILWKYINGNTWSGVEDLSNAGPCVTGNDNNRTMVVPDQDITLDAVCFGSCNVCNPPEVEITFQVDMSNEDISPNGVHVAGSFQGWNPGGTEMTNTGNDVYAVTLTLGAGDYYEYKFINGDSWGDDETVPPGCAANQNRFINVPDVSTTLDAVCFGSCDPCGGTPVDIQVTFNVDMSQQTISADGVHIAGGFQGWDPGATLMTDEGGGMYSYTTILSSGTYQEYKFINGIEWIAAENVPDECGNSNNRYFTVPENDTVFNAVCFGMCGPCPAPQEVDITFRVDMSEQTVSGDGVSVIGSFNGFDPSQTPMTDQGNGEWTVTVTLTEGDLHQYLFVNGLTEFETVPAECADDNGYRELTVPGEATTLPLVCFGACEPCVPPPTANVTFRVDMSNEVVSANGVHLAGSFQGWDPAATPMTDVGNGIYEVTLELESGIHETFKYINGDTFGEQETVPPACGEDDTYGGYNRFLDVPETDTTLDLVCFSSCTECVTPVDVEVTFQVDMQNETVSPDGVFIAGSFQGWNTTSDEMTLLQDQIYTYTTTLTAGEYYEYKFLNGNTAAGYEEVPDTCSSGSGNRMLTVPESDTTLGVVCFGACGACILPAEVEITFQVDMSEQTVAPEGVHVAGTFNNFSTSETALTDMGDGIWAVTLILTEGDYIMYKFVNGDTYQGFETVPAECSQEDGNRTLTVPGEALTLDAVCFGACGPCIPPPTVNVTFQVDMSNETVSSDGVHIAGSFNNFNPAATPLTDQGDGVYAVTVSLFEGDHVIYKYLNGNSFDFAETVPAQCGEDDGFGGYNRYLDVPSSAYTIPLHCFGSCSECVVPVDVEVTFQVDMSNEIVSGDGVHIAGSFNGFDPAATELTDSGNGVYAVTLILTAGDHILYKYINGNSFEFAEIVPEACGENDGFGGFNRYLDVPETAFEIPLHCFGSCDACVAMTHEITLFAGWNSLSSYLMPNDTDIEAMMSDISVELVIMQTMTEVYFPDGGLNTIVNWESQSAYKIKVTDDVTLNITGTPEQNKTLQLTEGWNLIPVISEDPVNVEALLAGLDGNIIVVKGIAETGIYWPEYFINTLVNLMPGKAYYVKTNADIEITFP